MEFAKPLHDVEVKEKESAKFECEVSRESAKVRLHAIGSDYIFHNVPGCDYCRFNVTVLVFVFISCIVSVLAFLI